MEYRVRTMPGDGRVERVADRDISQGKRSIRGYAFRNPDVRGKHVLLPVARPERRDNLGSDLTGCAGNNDAVHTSNPKRLPPTT